MLMAKKNTQRYSMPLFILGTQSSQNHKNKKGEQWLPEVRWEGEWDMV